MWKRHKWKDQEILHRSYDPTFFFNFEKNFLQKSDNFQKVGKNKNFIWKFHMIFIGNFHMKFLIFSTFWKMSDFSPNCFSMSKKYYFFRSWKKSWDIASMQNFLIFPFMTFSHTTNQFKLTKSSRNENAKFFFTNVRILVTCYVSLFM